MIILFTTLLIVGFVFLIKGADMFVASSSSIASRFNISPLIIGLTLVAFGTSLPELAVSFISSLSAKNLGLTADIAMGNVIGSNIANLTLILGTSAIFLPIAFHKSFKKPEYIFLLSSVILIAIVGFFFQIDSLIVWWESLILLFLFVLYIVIIIKSSKRNNTNLHEIPSMGQRKAIVFLLFGLFGVVLGGLLVTRGAEFIAIEVLTKAFSIELSKATTLVGLSIVALGTSLPELVTSVTAARKGEVDIALGNVIGSNIFNTLFIVGVSGTIVPLGLNKDVLTDMIILIVITIFILMNGIMKGKLTRFDGIIFVMIYLTYIIYIILRALSIV